MDALMVSLAGRLVDGALAGVEATLAGVLDCAEPSLVLDLSRVTACDLAGAALLADTARRARDRGGDVRLAEPSPAVRAWLRGDVLTGVRAFGSVGGAVLADPMDLVGAHGDVPCVEEPVPARRSRPQWSVSPSGRAPSRRGPASRRR